MNMELSNNLKEVKIGSIIEIPMHWNTIRLKDLGFLINGISKGKEYFGFGYPFVSYSNVYNDTINVNSISTYANSNKEEQKFYSVKESDVFFTRTSETLDEIGFASTVIETLPNAIFSGFVIRWRPKKRLLNKFYSKYLFRAHFNKNYLAGEINMVTRASLNQNVLSNLIVILPPPTEQTQIANYLDTKTQAIDKKINLLTTKIDYYKELRKTIINNAVTKGLDKNVKLKESGIAWIGKIPVHWEVKRLKDLTKTVKGKNLDFFDEPFENSLPNLSLDYLRNDKAAFINYCFTNDKTQLADENDFIIIWDGAGIGEILRAKKGFISSTTAKFIFDKKFSSKFFFHLRDNIEYTIKQIPTGMGIPHLNPQVLSNYTCPAPPLKEQTEIANYLDHKTSTIDKITTNLQTQINTLKELRKTLINDVVTGKVKVIA